MSGLVDVWKLNCVVVDCPLYNPTPFFAPAFILIDFYPTYVAVALYVISFYCWELYFGYASLCLFIDWGVNYVLRWLISAPQRFPGCGTSSGMPSFSSEQAILLNTLGLCFVLLWSHNTSAMKIGILNIITTVVIFARVYIGINTRQEIIVGAVVGFIEGIFFTLMFYYFRRFFAIFLEYSIVRRLGIIDNMCNLVVICKRDPERNKPRLVRMERLSGSKNIT